MKSVLTWIKSHLVIVICAVLILIVLPAGFVGASMWNTSIKESAQSAFNETKGQLDRQRRVTYTLPAVLEGETPIEETRAPNRAITQFFSEQRAQRERQVGAVLDDAVARNAAGHEVLVEGVFPSAPTQREQQRLIRELIAEIAGLDERTGVIERMLDDADAGGPVDAEQLSLVQGDLDSREREQMSQSGSEQPSVEQLEALGERLRNARLGEISRRANELSFYAEPDAFIGAAGGPEFGTLPSVMPAQGEIVPVTDAFVWQWDIWVMQDVINAIRTANSDPITGPASVPDAVVKRVDEVRVQRMEIAGGSAGNDFGGSDFDDPRAARFRDQRSGQGGFGQPAGGASAGSWAPTFTGRSAMPPEGADVRMVRLIAVVDSQRLPALLRTINASDLMTVTSVQLSEIDVWAELEQGYSFGPGHVVRATIDIETVWLRDWTAPLMPEAVRSALGVVLPEPALPEGENAEGMNNTDGP